MEEFDGRSGMRVVQVALEHRRELGDRRLRWLLQSQTHRQLQGHGNACRGRHTRYALDRHAQRPLVPEPRDVVEERGVARRVGRERRRGRIPSAIRLRRGQPSSRSRRRAPAARCRRERLLRHTQPAAPAARGVLAGAPCRHAQDRGRRLVVRFYRFTQPVPPRRFTQAVPPPEPLIQPPARFTQPPGLLIQPPGPLIQLPPRFTQPGLLIQPPGLFTQLAGPLIQPPGRFTQPPGPLIQLPFTQAALGALVAAKPPPRARVATAVDHCRTPCRKSRLPSSIDSDPGNGSVVHLVHGRPNCRRAGRTP